MSSRILAPAGAGFHGEGIDVSEANATNSSETAMGTVGQFGEWLLEAKLQEIFQNLSSKVTSPHEQY